ncbi:aminotransferase class V-fold PLP-dependent enzyme [Clostridium sp. FP1]|uniref:aminotransferase class V-fold PLP-dependent enzyme n=1 Tax=Clostridium sp. FP1 TaxID=2724076 RepID=UPI0013E935B0|nr:aminotransferase class V-fold PLP-dependent enzyme [Clostridium sp. FP1]MBZ9634601.1 aminotransferase class V-fold PLP-dependent enzyme [Clostridium sp. FP1]
MSNTIYLDNAATTFPKPEIVYKEMDSNYRKFGVNAGRSSYGLAREANNIISDTRKNLSELVGLDDYTKIIFTPSATIALNQIIGGLEWDSSKTVYVTPFEHNAIMRPLHYIQKKYNINIEVIPFDSETFELKRDEMQLKFATKYPDYIFMSHVSNVTGYILPIEEIISEGKKYDAIITVDGAQSVGLLPINIKNLDVDYLVFAAHKTLYGPFGIAGYIDNSSNSLNEFITGGTGSDSLNLNMPCKYPDKYEVASHNIQAIAGLNAAITWIKEVGIQNIFNKEKDLTEKLIQGLKDIYGIKLYLPKNMTNHVGIVSFNLNDYNPNELGQVLDGDFNIATRIGYHCAPLIHDFMNTKEKGGTVRVSLGYFNKQNDIEYIIKSLEKL